MYICNKCGKISFEEELLGCICGSNMISYKHKIDISKYQCVHCQSIYRSKVLSCINCGGTEFSVIDSGSSIIEGKKYSINPNNIEKNVSNMEQKILSILPTVIISAVMIGIYIAIHLIMNALKMSSFLLLGGVLWAILAYYIEKNQSKVIQIKSRNKANEKWILFTNLEFEMMPTNFLGFKRYYLIVRYMNPNGVWVTLQSKKTFRNIKKKRVDLLLNVNNPKQYYIDFGIEAITLW